jgi:type II secretory pathway predicted ATPase ExeA
MDISPLHAIPEPDQQFPPGSTDSGNKVHQQFPLMPFGGRVLRPVSGGPDAAPSSSGLFSLTYEPYYRLKEKPFSLSADPRFLFRSPEHAPAFDDLLSGIRRREGLITLTGEVGTGKTTLIRSVLQHLDRRTFSAFVPDPFVSREDLLKVLLVDFGVVSIADLKRGSLNGASRPDLSYPLYEFLDSLVPLQAFAVLIIDEAQNLPLPLLEEVRILSDLEGREKLLQVVLVGQPELREHLRLPEMRQVNQRVSVRCELAPLTRDGVAGYMHHRLRVAGDGQGCVEFSNAAIDAVYQGSQGTPRLVNLICDRALHRGYCARVGRIEPNLVWDAIGDLELEASRPDAAAPAPAAPPKTEAARIAPAPPAATPAAAPVAPGAPAPLMTRSAIRVPSPGRELLADFAPEPEQDASSEAVKAGIARGWKLVGAAMLVAVLASVGMLAYVRVQALSESPALALPKPPARIAASVPPVAPPGSERFTIQVASFETQSRADRLIQQLAAAGYWARAVEIAGERGRLVAVLVGDYQTVDEASADLPLLRSQYGLIDARLQPLMSAAAREP